MPPKRDPTDEEIAWVLGYLSARGWQGPKNEIERRREIVRRNGALGGRPSKDPDREAERLQRVRELRKEQLQDREGERLAKVRRLKSRPSNT